MFFSILFPTTNSSTRMGGLFARAILGLVLLGGGLTASPADAADSRLAGVVTDKAGKPLADISVSLKSADGSVDESATTSKKGKFTISGLDASKRYTIRLESEEYGPFQGPVELQADRTLEGTWPLLSRSEMEEQRAELALIEAKNKAARFYNDGAKLYNENKLDDAAASFQQAIEENPQLSIARAGLAKVQLEQEKYSDAVATLQEFIAQVPDEKVGHLMLFDAHTGLEQGADAAAVLDKLVSEFPSPETATRLFNSAVAEVKTNKLQEALEHFKFAVEMEPSLVQGYINMAHLHRAFGEWDETLAAVDVYLAKDPNHPRGLALRYEALRQVGTEEQAATALAVLKEQNPDGAARIFYDQGVKLFNASATAEALSSFQTVLAVAPNHGPGHYMLGLCLLNTGELAEAKRYLEKFLELAPDDPDAPSAREMLASM